MMGTPYDHPRMKPFNRLIARLAFELKAGAEEIQLLPDGEFSARDGRPGKGKTWRLDAAIAARLVILASVRQTPFVIDYDHQTIRAAENGAPAPAAGWFKVLEYRRGSGLWATDVKWTDTARTMIAAGEYKFISPVFAYDKSGAVTEMLLAAVTNTPALDELNEVQLRTAASLALSTLEEEPAMNETLKKLIAALGLAATTSEADALAACAALKGKADQVEGLTTQIATLQTQVMDPTKHAPRALVTELQGQVAALTERINDREVDDAITLAIAEGKLATPTEQEYAKTIGKKDVAALKQYIAATPAITALKRPQTGGKPPAGGTQQGELTEDQLAVCRAMNLDPKEYKQTMAAAA